MDRRGEVGSSRRLGAPGTGGRRLLGERSRGLPERMDDPDCDPQLLRNTYRQFARVNALLSGWGRVFARRVAPCLSPGSSILDVGCGGGDLALRFRAWSERAGTPAHVTGIDPDPRAVAFARSRPATAGVAFRQATVGELLDRSERFDVVVSNHVLHHLADDELVPFLQATAALARRAVVHCDGTRHPLAYAAFALTGPLFPQSFIVEDGLRSIRRAFTTEELRGLVPQAWEVRNLMPFRQLVFLDR